jgi:hypothetical protein
MNEIITNLEDVVKSIKTLSPELLCIAGLIIMGYIIKLVPWIHSKLLPGICILLGPLVYVFLINPEPGSVPPNIRNPMVYQLLIGLLLGSLAWIIHDKILNRLEDWLAAKYPWIGKILGTEPPKKEPEHQMKPEKPEPPYGGTITSILAAATIFLSGCVGTPKPVDQYMRLQDTVMLATAVYISKHPNSIPLLEDAYKWLGLFDAGNTPDATAALFKLFDRTDNGAIYRAMLISFLNELNRQGVDVSLPDVKVRYAEAVRVGIGIALGMPTTKATSPPPAVHPPKK